VQEYSLQELSLQEFSLQVFSLQHFALGSRFCATCFRKHWGYGPLFDNLI
jgi:hypothetical protein